MRTYKVYVEDWGEGPEDAVAIEAEDAGEAAEKHVERHHMRECFPGEDHTDEACVICPDGDVVRFNVVAWVSTGFSARAIT